MNRKLIERDYMARLVINCPGLYTDDELARVANWLRNLANDVEKKALTDGQFVAKLMGSVREAAERPGKRTEKTYFGGVITRQAQYGRDDE